MSAPLLIACDGSALKQPNGQIGGPIGWAWAREDGHWVSLGMPSGTNQRAELWALLTLLHFHPTGALHVQSDSQYTLNVAQTWMRGWARRGWVKADGSAVMNQDLIRPLHQILSHRKDHITYQWVKGHRTDNKYPLNTEADLRAGQGSARAKTFTFDPFEPFSYLDSKGRTHFPKMSELFAWVKTFEQYNQPA